MGVGFQGRNPLASKRAAEGLAASYITFYNNIKIVYLNNLFRSSIFYKFIKIIAVI